MSAFDRQRQMELNIGKSSLMPWGWTVPSLEILTLFHTYICINIYSINEAHFMSFYRCFQKWEAGRAVVG